MSKTAFVYIEAVCALLFCHATTDLFNFVVCPLASWTVTMV